MPNQTAMRKFFFPDSTALSAGAVAPLQENQRITIIDSLRGIALLGILLMNIPFFGMPFQVAENLNIRNEYSGPNYYTWWIVNTGFEGTMRGLFSDSFWCRNSTASFKARTKFCVKKPGRYLLQAFNMVIDFRSDQCFYFFMAR